MRPVGGLKDITEKNASTIDQYGWLHSGDKAALPAFPGGGHEGLEGGNPGDQEPPSRGGQSRYSIAYCTLGLQVPPQKVFEPSKPTPNTFLEGTWSPRGRNCSKCSWPTAVDDVYVGYGWYSAFVDLRVWCLSSKQLC